MDAAYLRYVDRVANQSTLGVTANKSAPGVATDPSTPWVTREVETDFKLKLSPEELRQLPGRATLDRVHALVNATACRHTDTNADPHPNRDPHWSVNSQANPKSHRFTTILANSDGNTRDATNKTGINIQFNTGSNLGSNTSNPTRHSSSANADDQSNPKSHPNPNPHWNDQSNPKSDRFTTILTNNKKSSNRDATNKTDVQAITDANPDPNPNPDPDPNPN